MFDELFGGGDYDNPADSAKVYYDQIPDTIKPYFQPYIDAGGTSLSSFQAQLKRMTEDPTSIYDDIGSHYEQSPGYQANVDAATKAAENAAAAGGQAGSPATQQALAKQISGYASQDYNHYVDQNLSTYNNGVSGLSDLTHLGYNASSTLADDLAQALMSEGNLAYTGTVNNNTSKSANNAAWAKAAGMATTALLI